MSAFRRVVAHHDLCEEEDVPTEVEKGIHSFEEVCEAAQCNTATGPVDPNTCDEDHGHDDDHDHEHAEPCG